MNGHVEEKYGGLGLSVLDCAIVSEELAYGCSGMQTAMEANGLAVSLQHIHTRPDERLHVLAQTDLLTHTTHSYAIMGLEVASESNGW